MRSLRGKQVIDWVASLMARLAIEREVVVVTVVETRGSAPREAGTRMLIGADRVDGTIGGGHLEFEAIRIARNALGTGRVQGNWLVRFPLAARLGQCCGGVATLAFQPVTTEATWPATLATLLDMNAAVTLVTPLGRTPCAPVIIVATANDAVATLPKEVHAAACALATRSDTRPLLVGHGAGTFFVERVVRNDFRIVLFGNGHVGCALAQVLGTLACSVTWVDQREHAFPASLPDNVTVLATDAPDDAVDAAAPGSMFLVMTHSHALDFDLTTAILARGDFAYFGLIGSASKRAQFERRLLARGTLREHLGRITCPIGIGGVRSKAPGAIAVAVAAQLLALREAQALNATTSSQATAA